MNSKYKVTKFSSKNFSDTEDLISIEEPLEISLKYKSENKWVNQNLSITMRTPGHDEDLVTGFLFNEQIITSLEDIASVESYGEKVGQYNIQNKILVTLINSRFEIIVEPVVVIPDMLSKNAFVKEKFKSEKMKGKDPNIAILNHDKAVRRNACCSVSCLS